MSLAIGLSPLARGTLNTGQQSGDLVRFIPAGAGNTYVGRRNHREGAVYPRWRGEHLKYGSPIFTNGSLSPLARGTLNTLNK